MEARPLRRYLRFVVIDFTRVLLGLAIAFFHAPLADFLRRQDCALAAAFRERGLLMPAGLPKRASHNLFFVLGIAVALLSLGRVWLAVR